MRSRCRPSRSAKQGPSPSSSPLPCRPSLEAGGKFARAGSGGPFSGRRLNGEPFYWHAVLAAIMHRIVLQPTSSNASTGNVFTTSAACPSSNRSSRASGRSSVSSVNQCRRRLGTPALARPRRRPCVPGAARSGGAPVPHSAHAGRRRGKRCSLGLGRLRRRAHS